MRLERVVEMCDSAIDRRLSPAAIISKLCSASDPDPYTSPFANAAMS